MKVLLINAPYIDIYGPIKKAAGTYFPLGIGYIASYIRQFDISVKLVDPQAQHLDDKDITDIIKEEQFDLIGISSATPEFYNAVNIAKLTRDNSPQTSIILGGCHASAMPEGILEEYHELFDFICIGEGEITVLEVCKLLGGELPDKRQIRGIAFWDKETAQTVRTEAREYITDLDMLPYPARDLVDMSLYHAHAHNARSNNTFQIITSRGCPFQCTFCASGLTLGKKYRMHSPEYIVSEIEFLMEQYGARHFLIQDDTFTINKARLKKTCEMIISKGLDIEWFCFSQVSVVDKETLELMKRAGCYSIGFGVESADETVLSNICKSIKPAQAENAIKMANSLGYKTQAFFIFGNEGDSKETINKTIRFALRSNPTLAFFNILVPYPGTEVFRKFMSEQPIQEIHWSDFVAIGVNPVGNIGELSKRNLQLLVLKANLLFYGRPTQIIRIIKTIKTKFEFTEYFRGSIGLFLQMISWFRGK
ncbi:MAG: B12-binding domain-containing radical SAM protein [Deltaproteobacteria bacterium]